jgi:sugar phosphate isomerase/epimerase
MAENLFSRRGFCAVVLVPAALAPPAPALYPCMHMATTRTAGFKASIAAYAKAGFRAVELWLASADDFLPQSSPAEMKRMLADHGLAPVSAGSVRSLFFARSPEHAKRMDELKARLELCAQLGIPFLVSPSVVNEKGIRSADFEAGAATAHEVGEIARQFKVVVGVEFLKTANYLGCLTSVLELCRKAGHPNVRPVLDTFHFHAGVSKMEDLDLLREGELGLLHICDVPASVPREVLGDGDRVLPGEGCIPLDKIVARVTAAGYRGPVSLELFNKTLWNEDPAAVARKALAAIRRVCAC